MLFRYHARTQYLERSPVSTRSTEMAFSQAVFSKLRIILSAAALLVASSGKGFAESERLQFEVSEVLDSGTMHYSDEALIVWRNSKLDLATASLDSGPLGLHQYALGTQSWLVWGWSSQGGGEEAHHLFLIRAIDGKLTLADQIIVSAPRGTSFFGIEIWEGRADISFVGGSFEEMKTAIRIQGAHFKERALEVFDVKPAGEEVLKGKKQWWAPYALQSRRPTELDWQLPISAMNGRFVVATRSKQ